MSITFTPPPRRILVRGVNWLGDAVMTTPALLRLREKFPAARITLLCPDKLKDLWLNHPAVDDVIPFTTEESFFSVAKKIRRWGETPSSPNFDLALVLPNSPRSAIEPWLAGIPQVIGRSRPWRNFFLTMPSTHLVNPQLGITKMRKRSIQEIKGLIQFPASSQIPAAKFAEAAHQVFDYLHLAAALDANPEPLAPQLALTPVEIEAAKKKFGLEKIVQPIFGLNPGAEYGPAKRWPAEKFIAAAKEIQAKTNCIWLIFGGKNDATTTAQIHSAIGNRQSAINLAGETSLRELMTLLKLCRVLLTNDTGPMHVAAALGTPVVVPFGSTSPELTGPGLPGDQHHRLLKSNAPCSPCFLRECPIDFRCMNNISVGRVVEAVLAAGR